MNDILDIEIILQRKKYPKIFNIGIILILIILVFVYIIFTYNYQSYYSAFGKIVDDKLELLVGIDDIKYIKNNHVIEIDNLKYTYVLYNISDNLYVDDNYQNYKYLYLQVNGLNSINNYVYEVKILKEKKVIAKYLKDYL